MSKSSIRISWDTDPSLTTSLLQLIKSKSIYQQVFFSTSIEQVKDKYLVSREACIEFFKNGNNLWLRDAEKRGLLTRSEDSLSWKATNKWNSGIANPITSRILHLRKRFNEGWYKTKYEVQDSHTQFEDIQKRSYRELFRKQHPYYFLCRELCHPQQPNPIQQLLLPEIPQERPEPPSRRRKRSPSTSLDSSSSSSDSDSEPGILLKSMRQVVTKARHSQSQSDEPDDEDIFRNTTTPLRALSLSHPPDLPNHTENQGEVIRFGMRPNITFRKDSNPSSVSRSTTTNDFDQSSNVAPPSPAPSASSSIVILSQPPSEISPQNSRNRSSVIRGANGNASMMNDNGPGSHADNAIQVGTTYQEEVKSEANHMPMTECERLMQEVTKSGFKLPFKVYLCVHKSVDQIVKKRLHVISTKLRIQVYTKAHKFRRATAKELVIPSEKKSTFIRVFVSPRDVNLVRENKLGNTTWMTPIRFLRFLLEERDKLDL